MAEFTAKDVMTLREQTGAGMMDCKKALVDAEGDMNKAADLLRERGIAKAAKRASKIAAEGVVYAYIEGNTGVLVEVNCESDFVAKGDRFRALVETVAKQIAATKPQDVETLLASTLPSGETVEGGTMGVMLNFACEENDVTKELAHNIALHVAFSKPQYMTKDEVSEETLAKEKEILMKEVMNEGKPANIAEKIVLGKIKKFYEENCLLDQKFIKDDKVTIAQLIAEEAKKAGCSVELKAFCFYVMGQGLEKKSEDLQEEVAKQVEAMKK